MRIFRLVLGILLFCGVCCSLPVPTEVRAGDARVLYEQVLAAQEKNLGADHPSTLITRGKLGTDLQRLGEYGKAKELYEQVLAAQEKRWALSIPSR